MRILFIYSIFFKKKSIEFNIYFLQKKGKKESHTHTQKISPETRRDAAAFYKAKIFIRWCTGG